MTLNTVIVELDTKGGAVFIKDNGEQFYWNDCYAPTVDFGPFPTVYDAMKHYTAALIERKAVKKGKPAAKVVELKANVVHVDFVARRRVG